MAYTILTESYKRRLPLITATADSADDLATLGTDYAEGSTCVIGETTYKLDKVQGWTDGSGGGGGGGGTLWVNLLYNSETYEYSADKTDAEIYAAIEDGKSVMLRYSESGTFDDFFVFTLYRVVYEPNSEYNDIMFVRYEVENTGVKMHYADVYPGGAASLTTDKYPNI